MSKVSLHVAALQVELIPGESRPARVERVLTELSSAPEADLLVLPELWDVGAFNYDDFEESANTLESGPVKEIVEIARRKGNTIVAGSVLERSGSSLHNTIAVCDSSGILATYRKRHLFSYQSREQALLTAGDEFVVCKTELGSIGLATCFDLRFPSQFAEMRRMGAVLLVVPSAWPLARLEHWNVLTRARAIETQTPLIACNATGIDSGGEMAGHSLILTAKGQELASASREQVWLEATINHDETTGWRKEFPVSEELLNA
jgi:predicted amidohydrolase